jgi:glycosyltransferase involved in cell wall biosynthesis
MKAGIFTPYSINPIHPRLEMYLKFFHDANIEVFVENLQIKPGVTAKLFSWAFINIFDFKALTILTKNLDEYDFILIQDLKYLPLAVVAKIKKKHVVYETLDNSVSIRIYNQRMHLLYPLIKLLKPFYCWIEKQIVIHFTNCTIVNSEALQEYFNYKAVLIPYSSPFEFSGIHNTPTNPPAFLYLGAISYNKGIEEIINLVEKWRIPLFIFGDCSETKYENKLQYNPLITWHNRINSIELISILEPVMTSFFLIGISLIKPVHLSYARQEANKEIDYLALGIPFIGNHRETTELKIKEGCGVFFEDVRGLSMLINDPDVRKNISIRCSEYYKKFFSINIYKPKIASLLRTDKNGCK